MRRPAAATAWAVLLALAGCGEAPPWQQAPAAALAVVASCAVAEVGLMEPFVVDVDLFVRDGLEVDFAPQLPAGCVGAVETGDPREFGNGSWRRTRLSLRATSGPGTLTVPAFVARAKDGLGEAQSAPIELRIRSALAADAGQAAFDAEVLEAPGPLLAPPWPWWALPMGGGILALVAGLGLALRRLLRRRAGAGPDAVLAPPEPAHEKALRALRRLRGGPRRTRAEIEAFYVGVSAALRVYLEDRFGLRAPERTTEEFLQDAERGGPLSASQCIELGRFLVQCDLVKFAAMQPPDDAHLATLAIAEDFVLETAPAPQEKA
jgi:hypothetical protein